MRRVFDVGVLGDHQLDGPAIDVRAAESGHEVVGGGRVAHLHHDHARPVGYKLDLRGGRARKKKKEKIIK